MRGIFGGHRVWRFAYDGGNDGATPKMKADDGRRFMNGDVDSAGKLKTVRQLHCHLRSVYMKDARIADPCSPLLLQCSRHTRHS